MSLNKNLNRGILIYGVGNVGSKLISMFLIPLVSFVILPEDLGYYDLVMTIIFFMLPITSFQLKETLFRFLLDEKSDEVRNKVIANVFFILIVLLLISSLLFISFHLIKGVRLFSLVLISIIVYSFYEVYIQYIRAILSSLFFVKINIINSFLVLTFSLIGVFLLKQSIIALFLSNIFARLLTLTYVELSRGGLLKYNKLDFLDKKLFKELINYSLPLLPAALLMAFIISYSKFEIFKTMGLTDNGIFAIVEKFAIPIQILGLSFYQSWQEVAIKEYNKSKDLYFSSSVFNKYSLLLALILIIYTFGLRFLSKWLIAPTYSASVGLIYSYCCAFWFYSMSMFFDLAFQCRRDTRLYLPSLISCFLFVPFYTDFLADHYGMDGIVFSAFISYVYLFIFKLIQTRSYLKIQLQWQFFISIFLMSVFYFVDKYSDIEMFNLIVSIFFSIILVFYYVKYIK